MLKRISVGRLFFSISISLQSTPMGLSNAALRGEIDELLELRQSQRGDLITYLR